MRELLIQLSQGNKMTESEIQLAMEKILNDEVTEIEIAAFLMGMGAANRTTSAEMFTISQTIRKYSTHHLTGVNGAMDNCGTGGDGCNSFNISTASSFVLAAGGIKIVKHGNRKITSQSGSMDVLQALGIKTRLTEDQAMASIRQDNLVFLNARYVHPKLKRIMEVRRKLKIPTIFNVIGPLTNPVSLTYQMVGVYDKQLLDVYGEVLQRCGRKRAAVIHGAGNMDEASLQGENIILLVEREQLKRIILRPEDVGLKRRNNTDLRGGNPYDNAQIMLNVLKGHSSVYRDAVVLNAGIGFYVAEKVSSIHEGVNKAMQILDSKKALQIYLTLAGGDKTCQTI